ncbi:UNVERIFIED_CONTAM: hypothetical protein Sradi_6146800 [Sesamum radiatum]|uniref:Uncharacterized protein n=1 Tax=Sesamum radiatum TaxID=300843 RepID=A0AAW2KK32_SESRA
MDTFKNTYVGKSLEIPDRIRNIKLTKTRPAKTSFWSLYLKRHPGLQLAGNLRLMIHPRNGMIRMIVGGPVGGDTYRARKAKIREAYGVYIKGSHGCRTRRGHPPSFNLDNKSNVDLGQPAMMPWSSPHYLLTIKLGVSS